MHTGRVTITPKFDTYNDAVVCAAMLSADGGCKELCKDGEYNEAAHRLSEWFYLYVYMINHYWYIDTDETAISTCIA